MENIPLHIKRAKVSQPIYRNLPPKIKAREENVAIYRRLTGNQSIPANKGYWTLCRDQKPDDEGTEIVQLQNLGLISKNQFFGVDWDQEFIRQNKEWHPDANWYCGDWVEIIREQENFDPSLVYLDTTNFADHIKAANTVSATMHLCKKGTVLLANAMLNDPRSRKRFDPSGLMRNLERRVGSLELKKWVPEISNYVYNGSSRTNMITYVFYKKEE
jgi:hypothetical protein